MSYSRWINSCWYTWGDTSNRFAACRRGCDVVFVTNEQVKQILDGDWTQFAQETSEEDRKELRQYLLAYAWDTMGAWLYAERRNFIQEMVDEKYLNPSVLTDEEFIKQWSSQEEQGNGN